jgi:hypothetical protein
LGSAAIELKIPKFCKAKQINTLEAFLLQYYTDTTGIRAELFRYRQKFIYLRGTYYCYCNSKAFYKYNRELVEVCINSCIIVDTAFFRKINPNYFRLTDLDIGNIYNLWEFAQLLYYISANDTSKSSFGKTSSIISFELASETFPDQAESSVVEQAEIADKNLLICCPTIPGFSLKDKL